MRGMMVTSPSTVQRLNLAKYLKSYKFCIYKLFQTFCGCKDRIIMEVAKERMAEARGERAFSAESHVNMKSLKTDVTCSMYYTTKGLLGTLQGE